MLRAISHIAIFVGLNFSTSFVIIFQIKDISCYIIHYGPLKQVFFI